MLNLFLPVSVSQSFSSVCLESCQGFNVYNFPLLNFLGPFPNVDLESLILISGNEKAGLVLVVCLPEEIAFGYMKIMFYFYAKPSLFPFLLFCTLRSWLIMLYYCCFILLFQLVMLGKGSWESINAIWYNTQLIHQK